MAGSKAPQQPDGSSQHYQSIEVPGADLDMRLRNANGSDESSYYLHIVHDGEDTTDHIQLHSGANSSSPAIAANTYSSSTTVTISGRSLRWYKSYGKTTGFGVLVARKPTNLIWTLQDVTYVPASEASSLSKQVGATLATLDLVPLEGKRSHAETGNLVWFKPQEKALQDAALVLVLSLFHRDRQMRTGGLLGPRGEVSHSRRTLGSTANSGWANAGIGDSMGGGIGLA